MKECRVRPWSDGQPIKMDIMTVRNWETRRIRLVVCLRRSCCTGSWII